MPFMLAWLLLSRRVSGGHGFFGKCLWGGELCELHGTEAERIFPADFRRGGDKEDLEVGFRHTDAIVSGLRLPTTMSTTQFRVEFADLATQNPPMPALSTIAVLTLDPELCSNTLIRADPFAMEALRRLTPRKYVCLVDKRTTLWDNAHPFHVSQLRLVFSGTPPADQLELGMLPDMTIPLASQSATGTPRPHPRNRIPLPLSADLPWPDCYVTALHAIPVRHRTLRSPGANITHWMAPKEYGKLAVQVEFDKRERWDNIVALNAQDNVFEPVEDSHLPTSSERCMLTGSFSYDLTAVENLPSAAEFLEDVDAIDRICVAALRGSEAHGVNVFNMSPPRRARSLSR
ncbi:hypothetical protein MKEN_01490900 [Mycena kentingensis (nom. inval.)]|nr:hypothetical protein MKEN_01490900 [Mycena kentingensis (nom. inval.)]